MALYRVQVVGAHYWRGAPKRYQMTFHYFVGATGPSFGGFVANMYAILQALYSSAAPGGIAEIKVYDTSKKGVPVFSQTYFNWETPSAWIPGTSDIWEGEGSVPPLSGENAVLFEQALPKSSSGKPVSLKTYWRGFAVANSDNGSPQTGPYATAATAQFKLLQSVSDGAGNGFIICSPRLQFPATTVTLGPYVVAHQAVRGRRRKVKAGSSAGTVSIDGQEYPIEAA